MKPVPLMIKYLAENIGKVSTRERDFINNVKDLEVKKLSGRQVVETYDIYNKLKGMGS